MSDLGKDFLWLYVGIMKSLHKTLLKNQLPTPDLLFPETVSLQDHQGLERCVCVCVCDFMILK